jgi:hypothetical protein
VSLLKQQFSHRTLHIKAPTSVKCTIHSLFFFCFQVIAGVNVRGWLDASSEPTNWMKNIRCTNSNSDVNVQHFLIAGHVSFFC